MRWRDAVGQSMLFVEASPARTFPAPGRAPVSAGSAPGCGGRCGASSRPCDPLGCWLRTSLLSGLAGLTTRSLRWKDSGTPAGRSWWVLGRSEPRTGGTGCGSSDEWNTPKASNGDRPVIHHPERKDGGQPNLPAQVLAWNTPRSRDWKRGGKDCLEPQEATWPTPRSADANRGPDYGATENHDGGGNLLGRIKSGPPAPESPSTDGSRPDWLRGSLNPDWVATLMGYPPDWCHLPAEVLSGLTATASSRMSRKQSAE